jgi:hypothetical protein
MTHTLHRAGTEENLADDYTMLCMPAKGINVEGSGTALRRFLEIALKHNATNIGDIETGSCFQTDTGAILDGVQDGTIVHAVFPDRESTFAALRQLAEEDLGLSVVVQGLCAEVPALIEEAGLSPHTVNHSLGRWGKTDLLAEQEVLEITTMCGHALVSAQLVIEMAQRVAAKKVSAEEAAEELAAQCVCGVFNARRAEALLKQFAKRLKET